MTTRFPDQPRSAVIQLPSAEPNGAKRPIPCTFQGMHGKRLTLETSECLPTSRVVSVEYDDTLFLGEVLSCVGSECTWSIEIKVEQILNGLQSLLALRSRLLSEGVPQPFAAPTVGLLN